MQRRHKGKKSRGENNFWSVPKKFKQMTKRKRKAEERQAVRRGEEPPKTKKSNMWDYW